MSVAKSVLVTHRLVPKKKKKPAPSPRHRARHQKIPLLLVLPDLLLQQYLPRSRSSLLPFRLVLEGKIWCTNKSDNAFAEHVTAVKPCSVVTPKSVKTVPTFVARSAPVIHPNLANTQTDTLETSIRPQSVLNGCGGSHACVYDTSATSAIIFLSRVNKLVANVVKTRDPRPGEILRRNKNLN
jgi:hypothetical protein